MPSSPQTKKSELQWSRAEKQAEWIGCSVSHLYYCASHKKSCKGFWVFRRRHTGAGMHRYVYLALDPNSLWALIKDRLDELAQHLSKNKPDHWPTAIGIDGRPDRKATRRNILTRELRSGLHRDTALRIADWLDIADCADEDLD